MGGRVTVEDAYAYSKFARMVLGTNDIDFRARPHSAEEADFLAANVAGQPMTVTYTDLEKAPAVLLAGFEPEEESPIVFLRLRKAVRKSGLQVKAIAPFATRTLTKLRGELITTAPGSEATALDGLADDAHLKLPGAIILVGERLATSPGALSAASRLADGDRRTAGVDTASGRRTRRVGGRCAPGSAARRSTGQRRVSPRADGRGMERQ